MHICADFQHSKTRREIQRENRHAQNVSSIETRFKREILLVKKEKRERQIGDEG